MKAEFAAARDARALQRANKLGHEWWPASKGSLAGRPTASDRKALRRKVCLALTQRQADLLTALSNVIFAVALLPTVLADAPPTPLTCGATIVALGMLQAVLLHFKLWWGCFWNAICASAWVILLIQGLS